MSIAFHIPNVHIFKCNLWDAMTSKRAETYYDVYLSFQNINKLNKMAILTLKHNLLPSLQKVKIDLTPNVLKIRYKQSLPKG